MCSFVGGPKDSLLQVYKENLLWGLKNEQWNLLRALWSTGREVWDMLWVLQESHFQLGVFDVHHG